MAYYPDLSPYTYYHRGVGPSIVNVGWLAGKHEYPQGAVPDLFIERVWVFCRQPMFQTRGFHVCELCTMSPLEEPWARRGEEILHLGSAEIRVFRENGIVYAAPNLIYHYVVEHHYCPPEEFIQAVLEGPLPGSPEYEALKKEKGWQ
jgi:hypothetical protein